MPAVHFLDVTNRDGVQTARTGLSKFGKTMVHFHLGKLGVAQSEIGFPFLFHEVPYVRANVALAQAGAVPLGLVHYNLSISTSDQMIARPGRPRRGPGRLGQHLRERHRRAGRQRRPACSTGWG